MTDLVLHNGVIRTMDPLRPTAKAIACTAGRVESLDETPPARRAIDLKGRAVYPGFIDAHVHLELLGEKLLRLDLSGVRDLDVAIGRIREKARRDEWVVAMNWDPPDFPPHAKLSAATPDSPVWIARKDLHSGLANAKAMAAAGAQSPTGWFYEFDTQKIEKFIPRPPLAEAFFAAQKLAMQHGVTGAHDASVDDDYLAMLREQDIGHRVRLRLHAMAWRPTPEGIIEFMETNGPVRGERLSVRAIKLFMDGSLGSRTAWMLEPFCGEPKTTGKSLLAPEDLERICHVALSRGYQVCTHAIGDRANRELLDIYDRVNPPGDVRWRIEHAQHIHPADTPRFARYIASVQPSHCVADRPLFESRLGPARYEGTYAWKKLGRLALGTDAPVDSIDPRWTFSCAVTRDGWRPEECLTPEEALRGMTADAAYAGFGETGVLAPGRPADMVVVTRDWLSIPAKEVMQTRVEMTMMDGKVAYEIR